MRTRNWRQYNKSLVQRGSLTFLIDPKSMKILAPKTKKGRGRPLEFSDLFIEMLLMIKIHFRLPYRQLEGFTRSLLEQSNAVCHGTDLDRDHAIQAIRAFGGDKVAKSIWGKLTGYSRRSLVETTFSRHKKIFGERFFSRTRDRQTVESRLKCVILNKMMRAAA